MQPSKFHDVPRFIVDLLLTSRDESLLCYSMSHGMFERLISRLTNKTLEFGVYCYIYAHWAPFHLEEGWALGIVTFLGVDLGYYWFHRMAHEINLFWATHSVHHSSEEYVRLFIILEHFFVQFKTFQRR